MQIFLFFFLPKIKMEKASFKTANISCDSIAVFLHECHNIATEEAHLYVLDPYLFIRIRIQAASHNTDPTDPDPHHCPDHKDPGPKSGYESRSEAGSGSVSKRFGSTTLITLQRFTYCFLILFFTSLWTRYDFFMI